MIKRSHHAWTSDSRAIAKEEKMLAQPKISYRRREDSVGPGDKHSPQGWSPGRIGPSTLGLPKCMTDGVKSRMGKWAVRFLKLNGVGALSLPLSLLASVPPKGSVTLSSTIYNYSKVKRAFDASSQYLRLWRFGDLISELLRRILSLISFSSMKRNKLEILILSREFTSPKIVELDDTFFTVGLLLHHQNYVIPYLCYGMAPKKRIGCRNFILQINAM